MQTPHPNPKKTQGKNLIMQPKWEKKKEIMAEVSLSYITQTLKKWCYTSVGSSKVHYFWETWHETDDVFEEQEKNIGLFGMCNSNSTQIKMIFIIQHEVKEILGSYSVKNIFKNPHIILPFLRGIGHRS